MEYLSCFPGYQCALRVAEMESHSLSDEALWGGFVLTNTPLVIRGAAASWPGSRAEFSEAVKSLHAVDNLFPKSSTLVREPIPEYGVAPVAPFAFRESLRNATPPMSGAEFLDELQRSPTLTAYGIPVAALEEFVSTQLGELPPVGRSFRRARLYQHRAFIYKKVYTDWHFHSADETITVQVVGDKEFLLLGPGSDVFDAMYTTCRRGLVGLRDLSHDSELQSLRPYRVRLHPGDALYIPVYWWHAVEACDEKPGVTVASTFRSPSSVQYDLRYAAARWFIRQAAALRPLWPMAAKQLIGGVYAFLRHPRSGPHTAHLGNSRSREAHSNCRPREVV